MSLSLLRGARSAGRSMLVLGRAGAASCAPTSSVCTRVVSRSFAFKIKNIVPSGGGGGSSSGGGSSGGGGGANFWRDPTTAILLLNTALYVLWSESDEAGYRYDARLLRLQRFLINNFTLSYTNVVINHNYLPLVTHVLSHTGFFEFAINTLIVATMRSTSQAMGGAPFLRLYALSGVAGGLFHLFSPFFIPDEWPSGGATNRYILLASPYAGANGAIAGVWTFEALMYRQPAALLFTSGLTALHAYYLYSGDTAARGNGTWLGGSLAGAAVYLLSRGRARRL